MTDELVTHDDVTRWLPQRIRDELDRSTPCLDGKPHQWRHRAFEITVAERAEPMILEHWYCTRPGCERVVKTDPTD